MTAKALVEAAIRHEANDGCQFGGYSEIVQPANDDQFAVRLQRSVQGSYIIAKACYCYTRLAEGRVELSRARARRRSEGETSANCSEHARISHWYPQSYGCPTTWSMGVSTCSRTIGLSLEAKMPRTPCGLPPNKYIGSPPQSPSGAECPCRWRVATHRLPLFYWRATSYHPTLSKRVF